MENYPYQSVEEWESFLGREVRRLRLARRLTQAELAERSNISLSTMKNLERGSGSSLASVISVARALGRTEWFGSFAPPEPQFSPMQLLQSRVATPTARRVRHRGRPQ